MAKRQSWPVKALPTAKTADGGLARSAGERDLGASRSRRRERRGAPARPNTTNIYFDYIEGEALIISLDLKRAGGFNRGGMLLRRD